MVGEYGAPAGGDALIIPLRSGPASVDPEVEIALLGPFFRDWKILADALHRHAGVPLLFRGAGQAAKVAFDPSSLPGGTACSC